MKICFDAGHGGTDPGATGFGLLEKDITLATVLKCREKLQAYQNVTVVLTRDSDRTVSLKARTDFANREKADLLVSVHVNGFGNASVTGTETFHWQGNGQGQALARAIQNNMIAKWKRNNRGVKTGNLHMLRESSMTAVLPESDFITNRQANDMMRRSGYVDEYADCIVDAIVAQYKLKRKPQPNPPQNTTTHTVKRGETYWSIAQQYGVAVTELERLNPYPSSALPVGSKVVIPTEGYITHTVKRGDTYWSLARDYNTTVEKIRAANPGVNENALSIGSKIRIPV